MRLPSRKILIFSSLFLIAFSLCRPLAAQNQAAFPDSSRLVPVVSILIPLHLDSLFAGQQYRFGQSIPRFALPYLEFYNGVQLAVEELNAQGVKATVQVIDSRRYGGLGTVLNASDTRNSSLLIGVARDAAELRQMADFARSQQIPFASATLPNDAGIKNNTQMAVMNTTVRTHCAGLVRYLQNNHAAQNITVLTRKGNAEAALAQWLQDAAAESVLPKPKWNWVTLPDTFSAAQLLPYLDSTRTTPLLVSSLDGAFAQRMLKQMAGFKGKYPASIIGMPTWDELELRKADYKGLEVVYSTPFVGMSSNIDLYKSLAGRYEKMANSKPSDMALKGYDITYRLVKRLAETSRPESLFAQAYPADAKAFTTWDFKPVKDKQTEAISYYENQKVYFIKKVDGLIKGIY